MSRQQLLDLYQRQVSLGGMATGGDGGLFSSEAKQGLADYRAFRAAHPGLPRAELSELWRMHKMGMGSALVGGRARPKGVRHCMEEVMEPSGVRRCARFAPGPAGMALVGGARRSKGEYMPGPAGMALVGGFPGQRGLLREWAKMNPSGPRSIARRCSLYNARAAYDREEAEGKHFKNGVVAAANALGVDVSPQFLAKLKKPRRRAPRARAPAIPRAVPRAAAPANPELLARVAAAEAAEAAREANRASREAEEAARMAEIGEVPLEEFFPEALSGTGARMMMRRR